MKNLLKLSIIILLNQYALTEEELSILEKKCTLHCKKAIKKIMAISEA